MGMVARPQGIASAYVVFFGVYGDVTRQALQRDISRQKLYREASQTVALLDGTAQRAEVERLQEQVRRLQQRVAELEKDLTQAVVIDDDLVDRFAAEAQAEGVSLPTMQGWLQRLLPERAPSVAKLGRSTQATAARVSALLPVLDEFAREQVKQISADEIYVKAPVLMVVEPDSMCWLTGSLTPEVSGEAWAKEFAKLPALEQVTRDAGSGLGRGVALLNERRQEQNLDPVADHLDHFHTAREGGRGQRKGNLRFHQAFGKAEKAQQEHDHNRQQGHYVRGDGSRVRHLWQHAEGILDEVQRTQKAWDKTQEALRLFTPTGELNSRAQAEAVLAQTLPELPDADFAKAKRLLNRPQTLTYLDEVHRKLAAVPGTAGVKQAAVRAEGLRRHPELLEGESPSAQTLRAVLLMCTVILAKAEAEGSSMTKLVRHIFRNTWRASSLVEGINSVLRMHQSRHRKLTQGLLDLKRLYWNCHTFRTGRRKGKSPYERLGLKLPEGMDWWELTKLTPEQLRDKLSALRGVI
jgi:hypothetical protein